MIYLQKLKNKNSIIYKEALKYKYVLFILAISILLSIIIQIALNSPISTADYDFYGADFEYISTEVEKSENYDIEGDLYTVIEDDPKLFVPIQDNAKLVKINFSQPLSESITVQFFFYNGKGQISEKNSEKFDLKANETELIIAIPESGNYLLRIDIGSFTGESFSLGDISTSIKDFSWAVKVSLLVSPLQTLALTILLFIIILMAYEYKDTIMKNEGKILEIITIVFSFLMFFIWANISPYASPPDETMRFDVINYVYTYGSLPHGGDPLIRNPIWGISYAFSPYISGIVSAMYMQITSLFTTDPDALILAARMAVVTFGVITVTYIIKIANQLFSGAYKWLFIYMTILIPQFVYLGSYMGNDMFALMSVSMIIYYWIMAYNTKLGLHSLVFVGLSISICSLSYSNAYPFILGSIIFYIAIAVKNKMDIKITLTKASIVVAVALLLAGWWFIRNAIIYEGDFIGMSTSYEYSTLYALDEYAFDQRETLQNQGVSLLDMLLDKWIVETVLSFIGEFDHVSILINDGIYFYYVLLFIILGALAVVLRYPKLNEETRKLITNESYEKMVIKKDILFNSVLLFSSLLVIGLSVYYSYSYDYQPQGRYIISVIVALMYFLTTGFEKMFIKLKLENKAAYIVFAIALVNLICLFSAMDTLTSKFL